MLIFNYPFQSLVDHSGKYTWQLLQCSHAIFMLNNTECAHCTMGDNVILITWSLCLFPAVYYRSAFTGRPKYHFTFHLLYIILYLSHWVTYLTGPMRSSTAVDILCEVESLTTWNFRQHPIFGQQPSIVYTTIFCSSISQKWGHCYITIQACLVMEIYW